MAPHVRVLLFCVSLLASPFLWDVGQRFGGDIVGWLLAIGVPVAAAAYAQAGQPKPPKGTQPPQAHAA